MKPDIEVRRVSDKRIEIYSSDGLKLANHRPRGWLNRRIGIWELHDMWEMNQWESDYPMSPAGNHLACREPPGLPGTTWPAGNHLACRISETDLIGFAGPTAGYLLDLSQRGRQRPVFLAASLYAMEWDSNGFFYACTSHSKHRRVIVSWVASF